MMHHSSKNTAFQPLRGALGKVQWWLQAASPPLVMLAAQSLREFESQQLPSHCIVTKRQNRGKRVPVRGRNQIARAQGTLAYWPEDNLLEAAAPSLLFVLDGKADIRIADYVVQMRAGDVLYIPARLPRYDASLPHYEKVTPDAHCDLLMFRADLASAQIIHAHICHSQGARHMRGGDGESCFVRGELLYRLFVGLGNELQNGGNHKCHQSLLCSFILLFQQEIERGGAFNSRQYPAGSSLTHGQGPIQEATQYMQNHLDKPLSTDQVARWVGLSRTAFTVQFRKEMNVSFKEYLTRLRLEQAKVLLSQSDLPIVRVSGRIGLTPGQLRNILQREYQCTPKEFRNAYKDVQY